MLIHSSKTHQLTIVGIILRVTVIMIMVAIIAVIIGVLRKWARDLEITIPAGRKGHWVRECTKKPANEKMKSGKLNQIARVMKVMEEYSVEQLSELQEMGNFIAD